MPIPLKTALIGERDRRGDLPRAADHPRPAASKSHFRQCDRDAVALDQPRLLRAGRSSSAERSADELEKLAQTDTDPFARYEAMQELMMRALIAGARGEVTGLRARDPRRSPRRLDPTRSTRHSRPKRSCCRARA